MTGETLILHGSNQADIYSLISNFPIRLEHTVSMLISCLCIRVLCALTNITGIIIITMILNPQASHTRE